MIAKITHPHCIRNSLPEKNHQPRPERNTANIEVLNSGHGDGHCLIRCKDLIILWNEEMIFPTTILRCGKYRFDYPFMTNYPLANQDEYNMAQFLFLNNLEATPNVPYKYITSGYPVDFRFHQPMVLDRISSYEIIDALELKGRLITTSALRRATYLTERFKIRTKVITSIEVSRILDGTYKLIPRDR